MASFLCKTVEKSVPCCTLVILPNIGKKAGKGSEKFSMGTKYTNKQTNKQTNIPFLKEGINLHRGEVHMGVFELIIVISYLLEILENLKS